MNEIPRLSEDGKTLVEVTDKTVRSVTIPEGVTCIGELAFSRCSSLREIILPPHIREIGDGVFRYCVALHKIYCRILFPNEVKVKENSFDKTVLGQSTLFVPTGLIGAYRQHPIFGKYSEIKDYS